MKTSACNRHRRDFPISRCNLVLVLSGPALCKVRGANPLHEAAVRARFLRQQARASAQYLRTSGNPVLTGFRPFNGGEIIGDYKYSYNEMGDLYGPHYVNRLYWPFNRNLNRNFRFLCYTNDLTGVIPEVECHPMIDMKYSSEWPDRRWNKLGVFAREEAYLIWNELALNQFGCMFINFAVGMYSFCYV